MSILLINRHNEVELAIAHERLMSNIIGYASDVQQHVNDLIVSYEANEYVPVSLVSVASNMAMLMTNIEQMQQVLHAGAQLGMGVSSEEDAPVEDPALTDPHMADDQPELAAEADVEDLEATQPVDSDPQYLLSDEADA